MTNDLAIRILNGDILGTTEQTHEAVAMAVKALSALPSSDVQPVRHGHWVYGEDDYGIDGYHCNKCGFFVPWDYTHKFINFIEDYHYCPHCNARMDEVT